MKRYLMVALAATLGVGSLSSADHPRAPERFGTSLHSYNEIATVSSVGRGRFSATVDEANQTMSFKLDYEELEGVVTMAHIHFGAPGTNGGVSIWLCQTAAAPAPASVAAITQTCPASPGSVMASITATAVVGPGPAVPPESPTTNGGQGISAGEFAEILRAIRAGYGYVNVHTLKFPGGEVRGQLRRERGRGDRDD